MLSDKPTPIKWASEFDSLSKTTKLVFTDISGKVTYESRLPSQQIKLSKELDTPEQRYNKALYNVGEALL